MAQNKYIIVKNEDAVRYLSPEQKQQFASILSTITAGRRKDNKSIGDLLFCLNLKDLFAGAALDAYIAAIHQEGSYENNKNVQAALDAAIDVRLQAALSVTPRLPD